MRSDTAVQRRRAEAAAIERDHGRAFPQVNAVSWAWLDLNQRPHPYQLNAGNRCADRRFPRSAPTVGAQGMRSISVLVCVVRTLRLEPLGEGGVATAGALGPDRLGQCA